MIKKILIIYPHFPPSNLAGVHRPRLFVQHLPSFGWDPVILTVHEDFYEEKPDHNIVKLLQKGLRIEKVNAFKRVGPVGDIGLRGFFQLFKKGKKLLSKESFDFLYIPIPSFYCALLGRLLHSSTGIKYGIDYIDPWVHYFPGSEKVFSRHWLSTQLAKFLEPIAVKKASLITGVAQGYYEPVLDRNPHLKNIITGAMPYGGEEKDHAIVAALQIEPYLFQKKVAKFQFVYAGAMLPKAYLPLENIFKAIAANRALFINTEFHFIGTGKTPDDKNGYNIKPLAEKFGLYNSIVFEYPARIPYLDVLVHLNISDAVFILGSTEPHYTPSKVYQAVLSAKPIFAVLHKDSSAVKVIEDTHVGIVRKFDGESDVINIANNFANDLISFLKFFKAFTPSQVDHKQFQEFSAFSVTEKLSVLLNKTMAL